ncbi:hypothetical protein DEJ51_06010 [Streptomyces venezuelae]|uniref:HEAT repeat domain-containing protein n=1 Tax=Streptomyces venezuelae TaxID=54571 RepID=A0A5P2DFF9_STRVZ|nr:hypothetical protein [Streptomyces venezuelae]QES53856.1 hypothetical protein DEJ51_06010 [Streptomyces venezuelae]
MSAGSHGGRGAGRAYAQSLTATAPDGAGSRLPDGAAAEWIDFDHEVRRIHRWSYGTRDSTAAAVRLCHPDGRRREAALREPGPVPELVAIRCTDWVPAVRDQARRLLAGALAGDPAGTLRRLTPLVLRLGRREQGVWALELFRAVLRGEPVAVATSWWELRPPRAVLEDPAGLLAELCRSADLPTRRFAARLTVDAGRLDVRELARLAAGELDPAAARVWTDAALAAMAAGGPDDGAIDTLLGAHGAMVRSAGVTALRGAGRTAEAPGHLADRSGMVRACARWLVRQGGGDPYPLYREVLADPDRVTRYAVAGFAECARRQDAPVLRALLEHPDGPVRAAALAGLRLLDVTDTELLREQLDDPSAAVAREAARSLTASAGLLPVDWLTARIAPGRPPHVRRAAYRLLFARGGVAGLRASVELLTDRDPALRTISAQRVQSMWSPYRTPDLPSRDPEVGVLLDRCTHLFSDHVMRQMRARLGLVTRSDDPEEQ